MSRKAIVTAALVWAIAASSVAQSVRSEETIQEILSSWREWRLTVDWFPAKEKPPRVRHRLASPVMPVDYSYDHLVDRP